MLEQISEMNETPKPAPHDFSLVLGGPVFRLFVRTRLIGDDLEFLHRRILLVALVAWPPLLVLSALEGNAVGGAIRIPFLHDIEAHVRFLIALPILIAAELVVHTRTSPLIRRFVERGIISAEDSPKFYASVDSAMRVRNSIVIEVVLLILVYTVGLWVWRSRTALATATWYAASAEAASNLTIAGYWYEFVSIPLLQLVLLRWYMRLCLWYWLLWRVSRLNLHLSAAHPDKAGGIGFLGKSSWAFGPILFAQGTLLSGLIANRILYDGGNLVSFKTEAAGLIGFFVLVIFGPLVMFTPLLMRTKRKGWAEYGLLSNRYVFRFEEKWIRGSAPDMSKLLGTGDIQSLADLGTSYSIVRDMQIVPFGLNDVIRLALVTAVPLLPLMLTQFSLEQVISRLFKIFF